MYDASSLIKNALENADRSARLAALRDSSHLWALGAQGFELNDRVTVDMMGTTGRELFGSLGKMCSSAGPGSESR